MSVCVRKKFLCSLLLLFLPVHSLFVNIQLVAFVSLGHHLFSLLIATEHLHSTDSSGLLNWHSKPLLMFKSILIRKSDIVAI